jgi:Domain of unknown function (DUF4394)
MKTNLFYVAGLAIAINGLALVNTANAANFQLIGLTDSNSLISFSADRPNNTKTTAITGLQTGESLLGFDRRPANNKFYGITNKNNLYIINTDTGVASFQRTLNIRANAGTFSGIDFNPKPDLLRLVNSNDENFRVNVDTGDVFDDSTVFNGKLNYKAGDINAGKNPNVNAVAYSNSFAPSPDPNRVTLLYGIDTSLDALVLQDPPNNGILTTIGSLGVDLGDKTGFDIFSTNKGINFAFASSGSTLYSIDIASTTSGNRASIVGSIGNGSNNIIGLASRATPEPSALAALASVGILGLLGLKRQKA